MTESNDSLLESFIRGMFHDIRNVTYELIVVNQTDTQSIPALDQIASIRKKIIQNLTLDTEQDLIVQATSVLENCFCHYQELVKLVETITDTPTRDRLIKTLSDLAVHLDGMQLLLKDWLSYPNSHP